jgi:hypothetical protein
MSAEINILAKAAFEIVRRSFAAVGPDELKTFRIKNLSNAESLELLGVWQKKADGAGLADVKVVVASDAPGEFPAQYRADPARSITWYRNNIRSGLVYVETKVESDEQGLKNLFTLQDQDYLGSTFAKFGIAEFMVRQTIPGTALASPPGELLVARLIEVLTHFHSFNVPVPVRRFLRFVCEVRKAAAVAGAAALEASEVDALVGAGLFHLGLFPDREWRAVEGKSARRLQLNMFRAELASSYASDYDSEKLAVDAMRTAFTAPDGSELTPRQQLIWRQACRKYCIEPQDALRLEIPYRIFEQIFEKDVKGLKLGDRVSEEIADAAQDRHPELVQLDVIDGLNRRRRDDAQKLLDAQPAAGGVLLCDLLTKTTRRLVERLAKPASRPIENPVLHLAKVVQVFRGRPEEASEDCTVEVRLLGEPAQETAGLLAFLYGGTLRKLAEDANARGDGWKLQVDKRLISAAEGPGLVELDEESGDDDAADSIQWSPLEIEYRLLDSDGRILDADPIVRWQPENIRYLALFWLATTAPDRAGANEILRVPSDMTAPDWLSGVTDRKISLTTVCGALGAYATQFSFVADYIESRTNFVEAAASGGLSVELLNDAFDTWSRLALQARTEAVPAGATHAGLQGFLRLDHVEGFGDGVLMLPSHPLRLRWIAAYLEATAGLASKALEGTLKLCSANQDYYLDWLEALSPHQHPALTAGAESHEFLFAEAERGWSEVFSPLKPEQAGLAANMADPAMLVEITRQVHAYLRAHPYKNEGLSLGLLLTHGSSLPVELVRSVRQGEFADIALRLTIIAPRAAWPTMRSQIEETEEGNRNLSDGAIFPDLELVFVDLVSDQPPSRVVADVSCDIVIVPEFLKEGVRPQQNTETPVNDVDRFDPLLAKPTYVYGGSGGADISVSLRPRPSDAYMSAWSTMVVRHHRGQAVAPTSPENDDFLDLRVNFSRNSEYFAVLHEVSHWVIAVERHLSRQQIESLPSRPDIVTVREGIGQGGLYTLVVSSNSARQLIVERLKRKLERILGPLTGHKVDAEQVASMALALYDRTRQLAPRLMLQALGISRVTEEILGVAVGQRYVSIKHPPPRDALLVVWLSLDEQADWFGGPSAVRADMVRITVVRDGDGLAVDILALESKLRRKEVDLHGVRQVALTLDLFQDAFAPAREKGAVDGKLWRDNLLAAIDAVDPKARWSPPGEEFALSDGALTDEAKAAFREGRYVLRSCSGIFVNCAYDLAGPASESASTDERVTLVQSTVDAIKEMLLAGQVDVPPEDAPSEARADARADLPETVAQAPFQQIDAPIFVPQPAAHPERNAGTAQAAADPGSAEDAALSTGAPPPARHVGKLSPAELQQRYQLVLDTLAIHRVDVRRAEEGVDAVVEGPALVLYRIRVAPGVDYRRVSEKGDALKLALKLAEQHEIRFSIDRGHISIEVPKNDEDRYYVSASDLWSRWERPAEGLAAPLGEDIVGRIVDLTLSSSNSPHLLIGGTTGSGKSEALNTLLGGLTRHYGAEELRLLLVDPKGTELNHLEGSPWLDGDIGFDDEDAIGMLERAVAEMERRYALFKAQKVKSLDQYNAGRTADRIPWWLIVLDEYADLTSDPDAKKAIEALLKRLAQKARASGIHLVIATQKPSAEVISTNLRSNLPAQLALRVRSAIESRVIMDEPGGEALAGRGDAFLKVEGRLIRLQCAKI